ncbi:hypothetical protein [Amycolatopsis sp. MtRt-6]|uniref:hypothetical protein n=1 Tax=Amycolatopsis sp. MtRt-6 TaxID=2792782 RepID=UPI001A8DA7AD|nr:hypothetical protein [Amycolatopsis sp. MtRt-6]
MPGSPQAQLALSGVSTAQRRHLIDEIRWRVRTAAPWRGVPMFAPLPPVGEVARPASPSNVTAPQVRLTTLHHGQ